MNPHVRILVGRLNCSSFLKGQEVTLPCFSRYTFLLHFESNYIHCHPCSPLLEGGKATLTPSGGKVALHPSDSRILADFFPFFFDDF